MKKLYLHMWESLYMYHGSVGTPLDCYVNTRTIIDKWCILCTKLTLDVNWSQCYFNIYWRYYKYALKISTLHFDNYNVLHSKDSSRKMKYLTINTFSHAQTVLTMFNDRHFWNIWQNSLHRFVPVLEKSKMFRFVALC